MLIICFKFYICDMQLVLIWLSLSNLFVKLFDHPKFSSNSAIAKDQDIDRVTKLQTDNMTKKQLQISFFFFKKKKRIFGFGFGFFHLAF